MNSKGIIDGILDVIRQDSGPMWSVGTTSDPETCRKKHNAKGWHVWVADDLDTALYVEAHFNHMKLTGYDLGCPMNGPSIFVYLFW